MSKTVKVQTVKVFKWIVTHSRFHQDELISFVLLKNFGEAEFPGIAKAKILRINNPNQVTAEELRALGNKSLTKASGKLTGPLNESQLLKLGILAVGVLKGMLDDHVGLGKSTCAAELVAEYLNVHKLREVQRLVEYAKHCDNTRDVRDFELPNLIKMMWRETDDAELIMETFSPFYELILRGGKNFQDEWRRFDEEKYEKLVFRVRGTDNATVRYGVFQGSDDRPYMVNVARQKGFDLIIVRTDKGNVQIFTNDKSKIDLDNEKLKLDISGVVVALRRKELEKAGVAHKHLTDGYLRQSDIAEDKHWHAPGFMENLLSMVLNGSNQAALGVAPTCLTNEEIIEAVETGCAGAIVAPVMKEEYAVPGIMRDEEERMEINLMIED